VILVCGLFLADRYNEVLLLASVLRCRQLEDTSHEIFENYVHSNMYLRLNLTTFIEDRVQKAKARPFSLIIYFLFIVACLSLSGVFLLAYYQHSSISPSPVYLWILVVQGIISVVFISLVHRNMSDLIRSILDEVVIENRIVIKKLFSKEVVDKTIHELALEIHRHYVDTNFTVLTIGIGGLHFAQRVITELKKLGRINIPSVALFAERVQVGKESFRIDIKRPEKHLIKDRDIIIVDDLVSTGLTLRKVFDLCKEYKAKSTHACILLNATPKRKVHNLPIYFKGLYTTEKGDFVGCGMDKQAECRDLPFIGIAKSYSPRNPADLQKNGFTSLRHLYKRKRPGKLTANS
jgi:hypoxanthine phosphoribosyltransferase